MSAGLMYIKDSIAYFCEEGTMGDDWDDRYRSLNAGPPNWWISRVIYWCPSVELADDVLPVDVINAGIVPWIGYPPGNRWLQAGATVEQFVSFIQECGGRAFVISGDE